MEQKTFYVAPEAKLRAARIRCSILAGSGNQTSEANEHGTNPNVNGDSMPWGNGGGAKERKNSLSF